MGEDNQTLQTMLEDGSISEDDATVSVDEGAAGSTAEDTPSGYETIINQQNQTISALIEQTNRLTEQINGLIRGGAQINDGKAAEDAQTISNDAGSLTDDYISLKELGAEFGKMKKHE